MRILVTGGAGFIGRHIVYRLVAAGHEVTITSTGSEPAPAGVAKILYAGLEGVDWRHVHGQDAVIHQMANNDTRCQDETEMFRANVFGPIRLFTLARRGGCRKFVFASSCAVYGSEPAPYDEDATPTRPLNVYGKSKAKFEEFAMEFAGDCAVTGLRYSNVYGPGEEHKGSRMSMVGQLLGAMRRGERPVLFEHGDQRRDFVYVADVAEANLCALQSDEPRGRIFNVGSGVAHSFNELVQTLNDALVAERALPGPLAPQYVPCPFAAEYQNYTLCKMEKAGREMNFTPRFDLRTGVEEYLSEVSG